jgi:tetratricopeptide (TPR) repeat protein
LLGLAYAGAGDLVGARRELRKAADLAPRSVPILRALGDCHLQANEPQKAETCYRRAVAIAPSDIENRTRLAALLAYKGERSAASALYRALIEDGARTPLVYAGLAETSDYSAERPEPLEYPVVTAMAEDTKLATPLRRMLHFSAAKIDRALARHAAEFAHYIRGKTLHADRFDLAYFSDFIEALKETVTPEYLSERASGAEQSERPVFIFGMPRSGTSLTEQFFAAHPSVAAAGELRFFSDVARSAGLSGRAPERSVAPASVPQKLRSLDAAHVGQIAARYLGQLPDGPRILRVTDKTPGNFLHLWLIALAFPRATYIHCRRDPLATCFSCFTTDIGDGHSYTADFATLARYYRLYQDLMQHWKKALPIEIVESTYENLVEDMETEGRKLLSAAGLPWDGACLDFHRSDRLVRTASYDAVREPVHKRSLEKWRAYESYVAPLREALAAAGVDGVAP